MNGIQCKMARVALGWGVRDLASSSDVAVQTITRLENGEILRQDTLDRIRETFEKAGIEFISNEGRGIGVNMIADGLINPRQSQPSESRIVYAVDVSSTNITIAGMDIREIFAKNLRNLRGDLDLSQEELARRAEVHRTYISSLERCVYSPTIDMVEGLAKILGVDASDMLKPGFVRGGGPEAGEE